MTTNATPVPDVTTEKGQSCSPHSRHSSQDSSSDMRSPRLGSDAPPARMGTHWETCGIDGGLWHWDCAQALIADLTRERDEAQAECERLRTILNSAELRLGCASLGKPNFYVIRKDILDAARGEGKP